MLLHVLITTIIVCGSCMFYASPGLLKAHVIVCALVIAQWLVNNNRCILSGEYESDSGYTADLVKRATGLTVSEDQANLVAYILTAGGGLASFLALQR
jgi:hypothetical protein